MSDLIRKIDILMNGVSMGRVSSVREIRSDIFSLEAELKEEKLQHGFTKISLDSTKTHLNSCETALSSRDDRIENLEKWLRELIVEVDPGDFGRLDVETTLDAYGLPPLQNNDYL